MQARVAGLQQQHPWPCNRGRPKSGRSQLLHRQRDTVLSPLLSLRLTFPQTSHRHRHQQYHRVILSEHLHHRCTFAPRHGSHTSPSEPLPPQAQASPTTPSSTRTKQPRLPLDRRSETTPSQRQQRHPGRRSHNGHHDNRSRSRIHRRKPRDSQSRSASPHRPTTATEQTLARVQLEKALWEKARRAHPSPSPPCNLLTAA